MKFNFFLLYPSYYYKCIIKLYISIIITYKKGFTMSQMLGVIFLLRIISVLISLFAQLRQFSISIIPIFALCIYVYVYMYNYKPF